MKNSEIQNLNIKKSNYFVNLDLLRGLSSLVIIIIHLTSEIIIFSKGANLDYNLAMFLNQIARFAVPVFIMLSGAGLALSKKKYDSHLDFLFYRAKKILPLYIFFILFYLFVFTDLAKIKFLTVISALVQGDSFYHLYYIPLIFQFYIIYPLVKKYFDSFKAVVGLFLINVILLVIYSYFSHNTPLSYIFNKGNVLIWLFYFVFGVWVSKYLGVLADKVKKYSFPIFVSACICLFFMIWETVFRINAGNDVSMSVSTSRPMIPFYTMLVFLGVITIQFSSKVVGVFKFFSNQSYGMYLIHPFVTEVFRGIYLKFTDEYQFNFVLIGFVFVTGISLLINKLMAIVSGKYRSFLVKANTGKVN